MKKSFIAIIALLVTGIISAQSKSDLFKEFQKLEEKLGEISLKYDKKFQKLQKNGSDKMIVDDFKESDFKEEDFKDFGKDDDYTSEDDSVKEAMKTFVEMHEDNIKNDTIGNEFEGIEEEKTSEKDKEFIKIQKEYEAERLKVEKKMYEIAKKYLAKK